MQVITGQTCPRCQKTFSTRSNMMYHYHHHCSQRDTSRSEPSIHQRHQQHHLNCGHLNQDPSCAQGSSNTLPSFPSVVGVKSNDPETSANAQCAVESGGLAVFLRNTVAERAREMSMPFRKPPFQKSTDKLALTLTVQTDPLQQIRLQFLFSLALVD